MEDHPALILKKDGGANYTTTDLATLDYRRKSWEPHEIIYVTDGRQGSTSSSCFKFSHGQPESGIQPPHTWFGSILVLTVNSFKTRSGIRSSSTIFSDEAEERALSGSAPRARI